MVTYTTRRDAIHPGRRRLHHHPVLSSLIGAATTVWQVAVLRAGAWAARDLRVPARNALLADIVPAAVYGRTYGFERAMDNLGAIAGALLALALVGLVGTCTVRMLLAVVALLAARRSSV